MSKKESTVESLSGCIACLVFILACAGGSWWRAGQKAAAYERATGVRVSTWDALFLDLRVDGTPK